MPHILLTNMLDSEKTHDQAVKELVILSVLLATSIVITLFSRMTVESDAKILLQVAIYLCNYAMASFLAVTNAAALQAIRTILPSQCTDYYSNAACSEVASWIRNLNIEIIIVSSLLAAIVFWKILIAIAMSTAADPHTSSILTRATLILPVMVDLFVGKCLLMPVYAPQAFSNLAPTQKPESICQGCGFAGALFGIVGITSWCLLILYDLVLVTGATIYCAIRLTQCFCAWALEQWYVRKIFCLPYERPAASSAQSVQPASVQPGSVEMQSPSRQSDKPPPPQYSVSAPNPAHSCETAV